MQPNQSSRVDLGELKAHIVKKIGVERARKYFYNLNRFLSQKLSKSEFDKSCHRLLGREILPVHNQLIRAILKNACQAKTPPPSHEVGPAKTYIQTSKGSPGKEDRKSGSLVPIWSNGVLPKSPRKVRSPAIRDRKLRDRPSPLGPNGKVVEDSGIKGIMENGELATPCDYQRPLHLLQPVAEQSEREILDVRLTEIQRSNSINLSKSTAVEHHQESSFSKNPLLAPLGIPVSGSRKAVPMTNSGKSVCCYDRGEVSDSETLQKRMDEIAAAQGLEGVSLECANTLNDMLDVYLKTLIRSCVHLVGGRPKWNPTHKNQVPINGMLLSNHLHMQGNNDSMEPKYRCSISLLDFKVAMELNPQQLGVDWPLQLEKICMRSFDE